MGHCLSDDLRIRVVSEVEKGSSCRAAASRFGVSAVERDPLGSSLSQDRLA